MNAPKRSGARPVSRTAPASTVGGLRTRVLTTDGAGPTVLLVHGFTDSADSWRAVMARLGDAGRRAVAVDLPHHGRAERPPADAFLPLIDEFVAAAVSRFDDGDGVLLVGNSVGGLAALHAAQRDDLPLVGVLAIGPAGLCTPSWMSALRRTRRISRPIVNRATVPLIRGTVTAPTFITAGFARAVAGGRLNQTARTQYASHWGPGDLRRLLLLGGQTIEELTRPDALPATPFTVPVTVGWGTKDLICPSRGVDALRRNHPEVDVQVLPDTGHCPQYDQPDLVTELIITILAAHGTPASTSIAEHVPAATHSP